MLVMAAVNKSHEYELIDDVERIIDPTEIRYDADETTRRDMARLKDTEDEIARRNEDDLRVYTYQSLWS